MFANHVLNRSLAGGAAALSAWIGFAPVASAGDWAVSFGVGLDTPYTQTVTRTIYTEPVYDYQTRSVWVEPEYVERVVPIRLPAAVETQTVSVRDQFGRITGYRQVTRVVQPERIEYRTERVLVRDGYYTTVTDRVLVSPSETRVVYDTVRPVVIDRPSLSFSYASYDRHRRWDDGPRLVHRALRPARHVALRIGH